MANGTVGTDFWFGFLGSVYSEIWGQALSSAMTQYRLWDPSWALAQDISALEKLNRDPVVSHATYLRKLGAAGTSWAIVPHDATPASAVCAKVTEAGLGELDDFLSLRFNLSEAITAGSRWARVWWEERRIAVAGTGGTNPDGTPAQALMMTWICPVVQRDVDKRRMRQYRVERPDVQKAPVSSDEDGNLEYEKRVDFPWQVWRPVQRVWQDKDEVDDGGTWVHHVVDDNENSLGSGNGVADPLYASAWARGQIIQYMLAGLESWSQGGVWVAEVASTVQGSLAAGRYEAAKRAVLPIIKAAKRDNAVAIPVGDKLTIVGPGEAWLNECITALRYFDAVITQRVLFAVLPTGGGGDVGSNARAGEEATTTMRVTLHDRARLQDTIGRDVIKEFWRRNQANLNLITIQGVPLGMGRPGSLRIMSEGARESLQAVDALVKLVAIAPVRRDEFYERVGLTPPGPNDKVIYMPVEEAKAQKLEAQAGEAEKKAGESQDAIDNEERQDDRERQRESAFVAFGLASGRIALEPSQAEFAAGDRKGWNLVYTWVCKCDPSSCKGCEYLGQNSPYTWGTLPTFPGTHDTPCGARCRCMLRARPGTREEHAKLSRRLGAGQRLERIETLTGWVPAALAGPKQGKAQTDMRNIIEQVAR